MTSVCTKSFVGWGFAPDRTGGAYSAGFKRPFLRTREVEMEGQEEHRCKKTFKKYFKTLKNVTKITKNIKKRFYIYRKGRRGGGEERNRGVATGVYRYIYHHISLP